MYGALRFRISSWPHAYSRNASSVITPSADRPANLNGPDPTGAVALSPGFSVSRYLLDITPKYGRQIWSSSGGYGSLKVTTNVRGSGVWIWSSGPSSDTTPAALVAGSTI